MKTPTLNFGKHKGKSISQIPLSYLAWLLTKYEGRSLSKEEIEAEAIRRGCEKRNGKWGIMRTNPASSALVDSLFPVTAEYDEDFNWDEADIGDEPYIYHGIPNMD